MRPTDKPPSGAGVESLFQFRIKIPGMKTRAVHNRTTNGSAFRAEGGIRSVSSGRAERFRIRGRLAGRAIVEWRCNSGAQLRSGTRAHQLDKMHSRVPG